MTDLDALGLVWTAIWNVYNTPMNLPIIGMTSPLKMSIYLGMLSLLVYMINKLFGNDGDE